jgi:hypothetical protein
LANEIAPLATWNQAESVCRGEFEFHRAGSVKGGRQEKLEAGVKWRF